MLIFPRQFPAVRSKASSGAASVHIPSRTGQISSSKVSAVGDLGNQLSFPTRQLSFDYTQSRECVFVWYRLLVEDKPSLFFFSSSLIYNMCKMFLTPQSVSQSVTWAGWQAGLVPTPFSLSLGTSGVVPSSMRPSSLSYRAPGVVAGWAHPGTWFGDPRSSSTVSFLWGNG